VEAESSRYPVTRLCRMAEVSRAAYYQWQEGRGSARQAADAALTAAIRAIHAASRGQYGVPRVLAELRAQGHDVGRQRVARLMAVATRSGNVAGVIFHSDRGCQYTSAEFRALCDAHGAQQSMGKTGVCWDNALAESFFATYKLELIEPESWPTRARARTATVHWLEAVYNRQRRHSAIDMLSPVDYEERYWDRRAAA